MDGQGAHTLTRYDTKENGSAEAKRPKGFVYDMKIAYEFLRLNRDIFLSRRTETAMQIVQMLFNLIMVGVFAQLVSINANIAQYGTSTFLEFFLIGQIINNIVFVTYGSVSMVVTARNFAGLYVTPIGLGMLFTGMNIWRILWRMLMNVVFIVLAMMFFNLVIYVNLAVILVFLSSFVLMIAIDLFAAGIMVATKITTDPVTWFLTATVNLVSGTYFPPENLPWWLQPLSAIHPQTYVLRLARLTMGGGADLVQVLPDFVHFTLAVIFLFAVGYGIFRYGFNRSRIQGTLGHI